MWIIPKILFIPTAIKAEKENVTGVVVRIDAKDEIDVAGKVWNWE